MLSMTTAAGMIDTSDTTTVECGRHTSYGNSDMPQKFGHCFFTMIQSFATCSSYTAGGKTLPHEHSFCLHHGTSTSTARHHHIVTKQVFRWI
jgi:hypothetical protein